MRTLAFPYLGDLVRHLTGLDLPIPLPTFGLLVCAAMLLSALCLQHELTRKRRSGEIGLAHMRVAHDAGRPAFALVPAEAIVPHLTFIVFVSGVAGSRLFHILEHVDEFLVRPAAFLWTRSGLSIFGGLTAGTLAGIMSIRRWRLPIRASLDAAAPAMMLGYAIGRIGCQVSGDGDWGVRADLASKPGWWPDWFWAQTYEGNIFGESIPLPGVYPAPVYETLGCLALFVLLWTVRRHPYRPGWLFSLYLLLAGLERLAIEQIRVNPPLDFGLFRATQAEAIACVFILLGCMGLAWLGRRQATTSVKPA